MLFSERANHTFDRTAAWLHQKGDRAGGHDHHDHHRRGEVPRQHARFHAGDFHVPLRRRGR